MHAAIVVPEQKGLTIAVVKLSSRSERMENCAYSGQVDYLCR